MISDSFMPVLFVKFFFLFIIGSLRSVSARCAFIAFARLVSIAREREDVVDTGKIDASLPMLTEQIGSQRAGYTLVHPPIASHRFVNTAITSTNTHAPGLIIKREAEEKKKIGFLADELQSLQQGREISRLAPFTNERDSRAIHRSESGLSTKSE